MKVVHFFPIILDNYLLKFGKEKDLLKDLEELFFILLIGKTGVDVVVLILVVVAMVDECWILSEDFVSTRIELYTLLW